MDGQIGVHSEAGHGTLFWFEIPLQKKVPDAQPVLPRAERFRGLRVLVVDDNATNREILAHQLAGWSMHYTGAADGEQALQELEQSAERPFDLAILDLHLPGMDGFELARAIRCDARWARLPLVMLSSISVGVDHPDRQNAPIDYYLSKPVRQSDLHDAIVTALSQSVLTPIGAPSSPALMPLAELVLARLGGRVLVVEDNPVNQQVAAAMLESLGVAYALADNGRIALDRVRQERFDLILMDCQMPEMDGFEATALIRARQCEGLLPGKLPIVALTANAVEGDRERCLAAGMDDYLSKPFTRERLATALGRWLPLIEDLVEPANPSETDTAEPPTKPVRSSAINIGFLDQLRALDPAGGMGLTRKILQVYLDSSGTLIAQIEQAIVTGDGETVRRAAHSLKSSSANVGAETLSGCFKQLESLGRDGKLAKASTEFTETRREYEQAVIEIRTMLAEGA